MVSEQKNNPRSGIGFFAVLLVVIILGIVILKTCRNTGSKTPEAKKNVASETTEREIINDTFGASENSQSKQSTDITGKVYFCRISEDGTQKMLAAFRKISSPNSLNAALEALLAGPTNAEAEHDIITNIPENTTLKSCKIEGDTAFLDFSSEFEINSFGRDSAMLQLKQIVFTATEYSDIKKVQFLINGENRTYLGGDGIVIGKPLSRDDFS
ncbi:MAG: GerMN domain-containing protein [Spirochaetales bacterium]|nr:GerMN domain-containing protein [Spirochaetales bacterium]